MLCLSLCVCAGLPAQLVPTSTAPAATPATGTTATASAQHKSLPTGPAGLDGRLLSQDGVRAAFHSLSSSADISLIEGCLGMFDSPAADGCEQGTTAQLAAWLHAPVVLIIDAQAFSTPRSVLALIRGCAAEDGSCSIAGVILNKAAKPGLAAETQEALKQAGLDTAVLGSVPLVGLWLLLWAGVNRAQLRAPAAAGVGCLSRVQCFVI